MGSYLLRGVLLGLTLAVLVGPIIFTLLEITLARGRRAGLAAAAGVWISDGGFLLLTAVAAGWLVTLRADPRTTLWLGTLGAVVLLVLGIQFIRRATTPLPEPALDRRRLSAAGYGRFFLDGWLVNTLNPFSVFFWLTVTTATFADPPPHPGYYWAFYGGILGTVILTDVLKVLFADYLRTHLRPRQVVWLRRAAGMALLCFALGLLVGAWW